MSEAVNLIHTYLWRKHHLPLMNAKYPGKFIKGAASSQPTPLIHLFNAIHKLRGVRVVNLRRRSNWQRLPLHTSEMIEAAPTGSVFMVVFIISRYCLLSARPLPRAIVPFASRAHPYSYPLLKQLSVLAFLSQRVHVYRRVRFGFQQRGTLIHDAKRFVGRHNIYNLIRMWLGDATRNEIPHQSRRQLHIRE